MKVPHQDSVDENKSYDLTIPPIVRFGFGRIAEVGSIAAVLGKQIWLVVGRHSFTTCGGRESLLSGFRQHRLDSQEVAHSCGEPTVQQLAKAVRNLPVDREGVIVVAVVVVQPLTLVKHYRLSQQILIQIQKSLQKR